MSTEANIFFLSDDQKHKVEAFLLEWKNSTPFIKVKTSGSTGAPKTIQIRKDHMVRSAYNTLSYFGIKEGEKAYLCLSVDTIAGKMMIVRAIVGQLKLIIGKVSTDSLLYCPKDVSFVALVPLQLTFAVENCAENLAAINYVITGGAPVSNSLQQQLADKHITVYQTFGMTETISHIAMRKIGFKKDEFFKALSGISFSQGSENTLIIHCPELGHQTLETNDIIELKDDHQFKWLGRKDHVINSGGVKIHPEEVEDKLSAIIQIPFFVAGIPDEKFGQKLILVVESTTVVSIDKTNFEKVLDKYQVPKEQWCFRGFIRTESNKINRIKTLKQIADVIAPIL
jgi:o-succinylbenzoate---CoA ligase